MALGAEAHGDAVNYVAVIKHIPTNNNLSIRVTPHRDDEASIPEATKDALYQAFLDKLVTLNNITLISSVKQGEFSTPVSPT